MEKNGKSNGFKNFIKKGIIRRSIETDRNSFVNFRLLKKRSKKGKRDPEKRKREEVDTEKPVAEGHRKSEDEGERGLMVMEEMVGRWNQNQTDGNLSADKKPSRLRHVHVCVLKETWRPDDGCET